MAAEPHLHRNLLHMSNMLQILLRMSSCLQITLFSHCSRTVLKKDDIPVTFPPKFKDPPQYLQSTTHNLTFPFKTFFSKCRIECVLYSVQHVSRKIQSSNIQTTKTHPFILESPPIWALHCSCRFLSCSKERQQCLWQSSLLCVVPPSSCLKFLHLYFK
jgi:hypothetical protein